MKEFFDKVDRSKKLAAEAAAEIRKLEDTLTELKESRETAAAAGDLEAYEKLGEDIRKTESKIYVKMKSARNISAVTPEDAMAAWKEESAKLSKEFARKLGEYRTEREKLCSKFEGALSSYNDLLKTREKLADAVGVPAETFVLQTAFPKDEATFPAQFRTASAEARFFFTTGLWKQFGNDPYTSLPNIPGLAALDSITRLNKAIDKLDFGH